MTVAVRVIVWPATIEVAEGVSVVVDVWELIWEPLGDALGGNG